MDDDRGPSLLAGAWVLTAISIAVLGLRLYTRIKITKAPGIDDWTMLVGTVGYTYSLMNNVPILIALLVSQCGVQHNDRGMCGYWTRKASGILGHDEDT